jgi:hypothetical protein
MPEKRLLRSSDKTIVYFNKESLKIPFAKKQIILIHYFDFGQFQLTEIK